LPLGKALCDSQAMKYKNISSAIHNFGHSFSSYENYVDEDFVIDELRNIHRKGYDISVNWLTREFEPSELLSRRIEKSIGYWADSLNEHLSKHNIEPSALKSIEFKWPARAVHYIVAMDDRGIEHKKEIKYAS
jgi:hypothetical protein